MSSQQLVKKGKTVTLALFGSPTRVTVRFVGKVGTGSPALDVIVDGAPLTKLQLPGQQVVMDAKRVDVKASNADILVEFTSPQSTPAPTPVPTPKPPTTPAPKCNVSARLITKPTSVEGTGGTRIQLEGLGLVDPEACRPGTVELSFFVMDKNGRQVAHSSKGATVESGVQGISLLTSEVKESQTVHVVLRAEAKGGKSAVETHTINVV